MAVTDCFISFNKCGISKVCFVHLIMYIQWPIPGRFHSISITVIIGFLHLLYSPDLGDCSSDEIRSIFRVFDQDGDGFISTAELRHVTTMVGEPMTAEELDAMVMEADLDKDGRISFEGRGYSTVTSHERHGVSNHRQFHWLFVLRVIHLGWTPFYFMYDPNCSTTFDVRSILQRHLLDVRTTSYIK